LLADRSERPERIERPGADSTRAANAGRGSDGLAGPGPDAAGTRSVAGPDRPARAGSEAAHAGRGAV